jgi:diaminopimelate decarboxylase
VKQDIAGPCCHAGDIVAHERELPLLEQGDYILAHDCGAYYYSAFCYYNSRQAPPIYGFEEGNEGHITLLKKGQTVEDTLQIFN